MTKSKNKMIKRISMAVAGLLAALGISVGMGNLADNDSKENNKTAEVQQNVDSSKLSGNLEVHYLDVGQGDATLIKCGDMTMLIDAGDNSQGMNVRTYLEKQGIERLDYVIGTHPDADHIGGLDVVIYNFDCGTILMPDEEKDTKTYDDVVQAIKSKSYKITLPEVGTTYSLGEARVTVIAPNDDYTDANNSSIGILLEFGDTTFLFTGDAEEEAERDILANGIDISADVYKAGHHGSRTASSEEFLEAVKPEAVVISCGEDNSYGHPHAEILNYCRMNNIPIYRTDMQGTIVAKSDGSTITWNMSPYDGY